MHDSVADPVVFSELGSFPVATLWIISSCRAAGRKSTSRNWCSALFHCVNSSTTASWTSSGRLLLWTSFLALLPLSFLVVLPLILSSLYPSVSLFVTYPWSPICSLGRVPNSSVGNTFLFWSYILVKKVASANGNIYPSIILHCRCNSEEKVNYNIGLLVNANNFIVNFDESP